MAFALTFGFLFLWSKYFAPKPQPVTAPTTTSSQEAASSTTAPVAAITPSSANVSKTTMATPNVQQIPVETYQTQTNDLKGLFTNQSGALTSVQLTHYLKEQGNSSNLFVKIKHSLDLNVHPLRDTGVVKNISNILHRLSNKNLYDFLKYNHMKVTANDIEFFKRNNLFSTQEFKSADIVHCHSFQVT